MSPLTPEEQAFADTIGPCDPQILKALALLAAAVDLVHQGKGSLSSRIRAGKTRKAADSIITKVLGEKM